MHGTFVDVAQQIEQVAHQRAFTCVHVTCRKGNDVNSDLSGSKKKGSGEKRGLGGWGRQEDCNKDDKTGRGRDNVRYGKGKPQMGEEKRAELLKWREADRNGGKGWRGRWGRGR